MPPDPNRKERQAERRRLRVLRRERRKVATRRGVAKMRRDPKGKRKKGKK
jgi:hypothetical protein